MAKTSFLHLPPKIRRLAIARHSLRTKKDFAPADIIRKQIETYGYKVEDLPADTIVYAGKENQNQHQEVDRRTGLVALFGSGEMSPSGRRIHEYLVKDLLPPIHIALLETPAGYETNPHHWYRKLETVLTVELQNFKPKISRIAALRNDEESGTNHAPTVDLLLSADYIHSGAGSPSYAQKHLHSSLAFNHIRTRNDAGFPLSFASAAAIAMGKHLLPVYEIYFVGEDPHWKPGLNFFAPWGIEPTIVPHWNNSEGGKDVDTRFAYMGEKRFQKLLAFLPAQTPVLGIDEHTACIFDCEKGTVLVMGLGKATVLRRGKRSVYPQGKTFPFELLQ